MSPLNGTERDISCVARVPIELEASSTLLPCMRPEWSSTKSLKASPGPIVRFLREAVRFLPLCRGASLFIKAIQDQTGHNCRFTRTMKQPFDNVRTPHSHLTLSSHSASPSPTRPQVHSLD